ncbi:MAG: 2-C-methyl-D-erythritol 4-phosphate cytidylyltransferase [Bacteroidetes bacterium]|nr:MAG: 2-C-methyl-D-erythritol 4-phosphate cytidylyltransferase [Bacteroidota bacterium]
MKKYCIIVAGGSGRRMKSAIPKQFLLLEGRPLLMHTIERFSSFEPAMDIILVLPAEHHNLWKGLCREHSFSVTHKVVAGGEERFHSVSAGLEAVREIAFAETGGAGAGTPPAGRPGAIEGVHFSGQGVAEESVLPGGPAGTYDRPGQVTEDILIAIHDGVRPLVSHDTIWRCFADAEEFGTAVPFIEPADSVRLLAGDDSRPVPRGEVRLIQTPQVFRGSVILNAYDRGYDPAFTDDATVAEASGVKIHLTHGNRENIKITTPEDLAVAQTLAGMAGQ